ncbi:hypothetical protein RDI58_003327 [Solanum bulbocastanum]|uniref:Uncharacterized protein n=1 Tax=Solanum bulbocastanum TaxID=147425 RepID=A0AAN8UHE2_SOLBU
MCINCTEGIIKQVYFRIMINSALSVVIVTRQVPWQFEERESRHLESDCVGAIDGT